jgi:hypothetical protein
MAPPTSQTTIKPSNRNEKIFHPEPRLGGLGGALIPMGAGMTGGAAGRNGGGGGGGLDGH